MGADFIMTGSINQCTVEAATSGFVKEMLSETEICDTAYAPSETLFEFGTKVQVLKKGTLFPVRANKLFQIYQQYESLSEIDEETKIQLENVYFNKTFDEIYESIIEKQPNLAQKAERNQKYKMLLLFKWYLQRGCLLALEEEEEQKVNFQVHCGPSLGAFNHWVKGTELESWRNRHVDDIGEKMMNETESLLRRRLDTLFLH